jgi:ABC-type multidrug transport system ATPase subunit
MDDIVLKTANLRKYFGKVHAVEEVSLEVRRGRIFGFLGPNGSGKTTTIGMILSLLRPNAGSVTLFGKPVTLGSNAPLRRVGALMGLPTLLPYMSARENLLLMKRFYPGVSTKRVDEVLEIVGLAGVGKRTVGKFSTGMKQRLGIAIALLHQPDLLILDEPTNGMDPAGMREIRNLLRSLAGGGMTVFLSSHLLHEVEQICDDVAILRQGRIVAQGKMEALLGKENAVVKVRVPSPAEAAAVLLAQPGVRKAEVDGPYVLVEGISSEAVIVCLVERRMVPSEVTSGRPDLEQIFLELTGSDIS